MSNKLGWVIKIVAWFAIYFTFSMAYDGDMPFWIYFLVVFLCFMVNSIVNHFVKDKGGKTPESKAQEDVKTDSEDSNEK